MKAKLFYQFLPLLFLSIFFCSCSPKIYFTKEVRDFAETNKIPLTKVQFYVDRNVELRREVTSGDVKASSGKIVLENGKYVHIILLDTRTGGACIKVRDNRTLDIAFETGDNKFLTFNSPAVKFLDKSDSKYELVIGDYNSNRDASEIKYEGYTYYVNRTDAMATLKVKKKSFSKLKVNERRMKGVKVK